MEEDAIYEGNCQGGPLDGQPGSSRFPSGFLLVDKAANKAWVYDWTGTVFNSRFEQPETLEYERRIKAAMSFDWDVRAWGE